MVGLHSQLIAAAWLIWAMSYYLAGIVTGGCLAYLVYAYWRSE